MQSGAKRVLIVEDAAETRKLIRHHLEHIGLAVEEAADAREALQRVARESFDLVCLDLMLPESSGYEICEQLKSSPQHKAIPVLVISVRNLPSDRAYAAEIGAAGYLVKPFSRAKLVKQVQALLDSAG